MKKQRYHCRHCGFEFVEEVFEPGESEEKGIPGYPLRCRRCKGGAVSEV